MQKEERDNIVRPVEFIEPEMPAPGPPPGRKYSTKDEPLIEARTRDKKKSRKNRK